MLLKQQWNVKRDGAERNAEVCMPHAKIDCLPSFVLVMQSSPHFQYLRAFIMISMKPARYMNGCVFTASGDVRAEEPKQN